jgi:hypothetical protein
MKSLQSLANNIRYPSDQNHKPAVKQVVPEQALLIINQLFLDLKAIFPAWKAAFPSTLIEQCAKKEWIKAFIENGIGQTEQLKLGVKKARNYSQPFFPSCGQFIAWCKPDLEDYGLWPVDVALKMVVDGHKRQHEVLYLAAKSTGMSNLRKMSHKALLPLFARNYDIACARFISGEDLGTVIPLALPEKVLVPVPATAQFKAMRDKIKQNKGVS